jgi:hypothetical protein
MILDVAESDLGQFSAACPVFDCRDWRKAWENSEFFVSGIDLNLGLQHYESGLMATESRRNLHMLLLTGICCISYVKNGIQSVWRRMVGWQMALPSHLVYAGFLLVWFSAMKMEVICFSETSVHIRSARRYVPEDGSICNYRCENHKSALII